MSRKAIQPETCSEQLLSLLALSSVLFLIVVCYFLGKSPGFTHLFHCFCKIIFRAPRLCNIDRIMEGYSPGDLHAALLYIVYYCPIVIVLTGTLYTPLNKVFIVLCLFVRQLCLKQFTDIACMYNQIALYL